ncbi:MAG: hypothetical protein PHD82_11875 [Candidatus Riflebacteria bacterium]|nr:hypothetical protein [Candidatus Riflebacteria bacterium]
MRKSVKSLLLLALILWCSLGYALTPLEVYTDARRAFDLGRWQESSEIFTRFMSTWPDHKLRYEALYYFSLASARTLEDRSRAYSDALVDDIASAIGTLTAELPDKDLTELQVAVKLSRDNTRPATWSEMANLTPVELKHHLAREWHPNPSHTPLETLHWEGTWKQNNKNAPPDLKASIALLKARALWQIMLSPLSMSANSEILKKWGCWPVNTCFEKEIDYGFRHGSAENRRELALLGYGYDCLRTVGFGKNSESPLRGRWYAYLVERGINLQEAWCPR